MHAIAANDDEMAAITMPRLQLLRCGAICGEEDQVDIADDECDDRPTLKGDDYLFLFCFVSSLPC